MSNAVSQTEVASIPNWATSMVRNYRVQCNLPDFVTDVEIFDCVNNCKGMEEEDVISVVASLAEPKVYVDDSIKNGFDILEDDVQQILDEDKPVDLSTLERTEAEMRAIADEAVAFVEENFADIILQGIEENQVPDVQPVDMSHSPSVEPASEDDIKTFVSQMKSSGQDEVFNALATAFAAEQLDPMLKAFKYRNAVKDMTTQLSACVNAITTLANVLGIKNDGNVVKPDQNFTNWPIARLKSVFASIESTVQTLQEREAFATARVKEADEKLKLLAERAENASSAHGTIVAAAESRAELHQKAVVSANQLLAKFNETDSFVVAMLDDVTRKPVKFLKVVDDVFKSVEKWSLGTRWSSFAKANNQRIALIRARQEQMRINVRKNSKGETIDSVAMATKRDALSASYAVLRVHLLHVRREDMR